jgi:hypothetical protein
MTKKKKTLENQAQCAIPIVNKSYSGEKPLNEMDIDDMIEKYNPNYRLDWRKQIKDAEINSGMKLGEALVLFEKVLMSVG